jgi:hypothetical protein
MARFRRRLRPGSAKGALPQRACVRSPGLSRHCVFKMLQRLDLDSPQRRKDRRENYSFNLPLRGRQMKNNQPMARNESDINNVKCNFQWGIVHIRTISKTDLCFFRGLCVFLFAVLSTANKYLSRFAASAPAVKPISIFLLLGYQSTICHRIYEAMPLANQ